MRASSQTMNPFEQRKAGEATTADYYLALPYRDLSGLHSGQWACVRARFAISSGRFCRVLLP